MMHRLAARTVLNPIAVLAFSTLFGLAALAPDSLFAQEDVAPAATQGTLLITLKLAKQPDHPATIPYTIALPQSCSSCQIVTDITYLAQNPREIDFAVRVPTSTALPMSVRTDPSAVRRVLLEGTDLDFTRTADGIQFNLPAQTTDRINSAEFHTHIVYPGLDVRFEHADPERKAGYYANIPFPTLQRQAAANIEFAQREAVFMLGLNTYVADQQIGNILLMGFDTNDPHGHTDAPPHMHMHMRWPQRGGTQIGHFYINDHGLLTENRVGVQGWNNGHIKPFLPGESFTTYDLRAKGVYTHTITKEGWLNLGRPGGSECHIRPAVAGRGFDQDALVECPGFAQRRVSVRDNIATGTLTVTIEDTQGQRSEVYHYDTDTGLLLSGN